MEIITPSYAPDADLCDDLVRSVARYAPQGTRHTLLVPEGDLDRFAPAAQVGARVLGVRAVMPRGLIKIPHVNAWVNVRAPWPPVRGWIAQQIIKLEAASRSTADIALVVDSDVTFIRPFSADDFLVDGAVPVYALAEAVSAELPRHMIWNAVARRLLGLAPVDAARHPDHICWPCAWDPAIVRAALQRVTDVTGLPWAHAVGRELHFSEMVLYGVFAQEIAGVSALTQDMHCPSFSDERALSSGEVDAFLDDVAPSDVAVMISAKSGTDLTERRRAIARVAAR